MEEKLVTHLVIRSKKIKQYNLFKKLKKINSTVPKLVNNLYLCKKELRVVAKKILRDFWEKHADCEQQLKSWFQEVQKSEWKNPNQIKLDYPSASILNNNRVVFNIKGNNYRLIAKISFEYQMVWIRFIGTHGEYDKINANTI